MMKTRDEWLALLRPGDPVMISPSYGLDYPATIDRITPTRRFVVGRLTFDCHGRQMNGLSHRRAWLEIWTQGKADAANLTVRASKLTEIKEADWKALGLERVTAILAEVRAVRAVPKEAT